MWNNSKIKYIKNKKQNKKIRNKKTTKKTKTKNDKKTPKYIKSNCKQLNVSNCQYFGIGNMADELFVFDHFVKLALNELQNVHSIGDVDLIHAVLVSNNWSMPIQTL